MPKINSVMVAYETPDDPNDIDMSDKPIPVMPGKADLDRGYVAIPEKQCYRKTNYTNWSESQDDATEVGGFVPRSNFDERL